jgi:formylglycine-generating enzyme required for sulfatase activity/tRNA A-37 threonylcarbamoyl transferase component Bud32
MPDLLERLRAAVSDRYAIERELGAGGMATVYLARDLKHDRHVALKVLRPELASVLGGERFLREIEIAARIEHPHILTLIDSGDADGILYYVMPYMKGESLRDRLSREGKLPIADAIRMLRDVADGLAEAHSHGLVHRDIKPDNVMMSGNHAVVMDFGVAKAVTSATGPQDLTTTGIALGTPSYMSPEQASADPNIDHRTDIYAMGALGYELLAGRPPFLGASAQEILAAHLVTEPAPVSQHRADTPPALEAVVMKCLAKRPADRWQKTDEVLQRLEAIVTPSGGVPSTTISAATLGRAPVKRSVWRTAAIAVAVVLLATVVFVQQRGASATRALAADMRAAAESGNLDAAYVLLAASGRDLGDRAFVPIADTFGGVVTIATEPAGAAVEVARGLGSLDSVASAVLLGRAPIEHRVLLAGHYRLTVAADDYVTGEFTFGLSAGDTIVVTAELVPAAWDAEGMVLVSAGSVPGPLAPRSEGAELPAFLIDRHEVSNRQYMRFVGDGGYRDLDMWPDSMLTRNGWVARETALAALVDRTGLPGPRGWSGGQFPDGRADHPVTGISWYEAAAYARWAGKSLPTAEQWWRAALGDRGSRFPWGNDLVTIDDRSNFGGVSTTPVGRFPFGASPFGAHDMAGNVREWMAGPASATRFAVMGGSWQTPTYMFDSPNVESFGPWFQSEELGFRLVMPLPNR